MASDALSPGPTLGLRPKFALFGLLGLMFLLVLYANERFLIDPADPSWVHFEPFKWWLLPHGVMGGLALIVGPFQFSDRLRRRFPKVHRVSGRVYAAGVLVSAPLGYYIQHLQGPPAFNAAAAVQAFNWLTTTAIALYFIRTRNIPRHRVWMARSFAVAVVFLEVRVILFFLPGPSSVETIMTVVWICNGLALLKADIVLQVEEVLRRRRAPAPARSAVAV